MFLKERGRGICNLLGYFFQMPIFGLNGVELGMSRVSRVFRQVLGWHCCTVGIISAVSNERKYLHLSTEFFLPQKQCFGHDQLSAAGTWTVIRLTFIEHVSSQALCWH